MASPDFSPYADLTIFDRQPGDVYLDAVEYARTALPEFEPRVGTVEDALLQSVAFVGGELIAAINRLPNGIFEGLLNLFQFPRRQATFARGFAVFTSVDATGVRIPAGTQVGYLNETNEGTILSVFQTEEPASIATGQTVSGLVPIVSVGSGEVPPIEDGQQLLLLTTSNKLFSVELSGNIDPGKPGESDFEYFTRASTHIASLSEALATSRQITKKILSILANSVGTDIVFEDIEYSNAWRANTYDLTSSPSIQPTGDFARTTGVVTVTVPTGHGVVAGLEPDYVRVYTPRDPDNPESVDGSNFDGIFVVSGVTSTSISWEQPGDNDTFDASASKIYNMTNIATDASNVPGHATAFICDEHGVPPTINDAEVILDEVRERAIVGLTVHYVPPLIIDVNLTCTLTINESYSAVEVIDVAKQYIEDVISPTQFPWTSRLRLNYAIAKVAQVEGVDYVNSISLDLPDDTAAYLEDGDVVFAYRGTLPRVSATITSAV
jgi:hypothetical protein